MPPPGKIDVVRNGRTFTIDESQLTAALDQGFALETAEQRDTRARAQVDEEKYGGALGTAAAVIAAPLRGATLGLSDAYLATQGDTLRDFVQGAKEANPTISTVGEIGGAVLPTLLSGGAATPTALASRAGRAIAQGGSKGVARAVAGGAVEGALQGLGTGVSNLALQDEPLTLEHMVSELSSNALFGGVVGGAAGGLGKVAEKGLIKAKGAIDDYVARQAATSSEGLGDDLAKIVESGDEDALAAYVAKENTAVKASRAAESETIVGDLKGFRDELAEQKIYLAAKEAADRETREAGAMVAKADARLRNILNNPKDLAASPRTALSVLRQQEHAYEQLAAKADDIRAAVKTPESSVRAAGLDNLPAALERNRAFQQRLTDVLGDLDSPNLQAAAKAKEVMKAQAEAAKEAKNSIGAQLLGGTVFGAVASAASAIPVVGTLAGPVLGAKAAKFAVNAVVGRLGNAATAAAERTSKAIGAVLSVAPAAQKVAPVLATKVLGAVRYAPPSEKERDIKPEDAKPAKLADLYRARSAELRSQVAPDETGQPRMRPEARARVTGMLAGVRAENPIAADRMETIAARRVEFLAAKLPKRPDLVRVPGGPDRWQPSDMQMREFARYAAAVEDPGGVEERLAAGSITPEDAEAYKAVYPERFAALQMGLLEQLPTLQATLPYQKRLAISIFSGVPVDPAMTPNILAVLQGSYAAEEDAGAEGGMSAPTAAPQFGSVSRPQGTPSQERAA